MDNGESPPVCDAAFLDQVAYTRRRVERYEAVFGRGFVSTGGLRTTEKLTSGLPALLGGGEEDRIRILDVGSGAGGSAFHLAKTLRAAEVTGVDLSANMVQIAEERKGEQEEEVRRRVRFLRGDAAGEKPLFPSNYFDLVYSRDCVMHVADKEGLYKRIKEYLKPGGELLVTEYLRGSAVRDGGGGGGGGDGWRRYQERRGYKLWGREKYQKVLEEEVGFADVRVTDITGDLVEALMREEREMEENKEEFVKKFSKGDFQDVLSGWGVKKAAARDELLAWGLIRARKKEEGNGLD